MSKLVQVSQIGRDVYKPNNPGELDEIIKQLDKTVSKHHGLGLSACQIGVNQRIFVFLAGSTIRSDGTYDVSNAMKRVLVNPSIISMSSQEGSVLSVEGCLSVPSLIGIVPRYKKIGVKSLRYDGGILREDVEEFFGADSLIIQHEMDHLDGILFIDRVKLKHKIKNYI